MQVNGLAQVRLQGIHGAVNKRRKIGLGDCLGWGGCAVGAVVPPFVGSRFTAPVGASPVHVKMIGDAVEPRVEGGTCRKGWKSLPRPAESALGEVRGVGIVAGKAPQECKNAGIMKFDQLASRGS